MYVFKHFNRFNFHQLKVSSTIRPAPMLSSNIIPGGNPLSFLFHRRGGKLQVDPRQSDWTESRLWVCQLSPARRCFQSNPDSEWVAITKQNYKGQIPPLSLSLLTDQCFHLQVSFARPSSEAIKGANLYVSGLPKHMTQPDLERLFASCGNIITSRILCDNISGNIMNIS